jgi:hypothetical protein
MMDSIGDNQKQQLISDRKLKRKVEGEEEPSNLELQEPNDDNHDSEPTDEHREKKPKFESIQSLTIENNRLKLQRFIQSDARIGYPLKRPNFQWFPHGWFFDSHIETIDVILAVKPETSNLLSLSFAGCINVFFFLLEFVIELGAWLGRSAIHFARTIPQAIIFSIDLWSNEHLLQDVHYTTSSENKTILDSKPIYEQFLANTWDYAFNLEKFAGIIPIKMNTIDALELIANLSIPIDMIYIDANHHYDAVLQDIDTVTRLFPEAHILGDDWDYPDVQRAAKEIAHQKNYQYRVVEGKCWSYLKPGILDEVRRREKDKVVKAKASIEVENNRKKNMDNSKKSFSDLLQAYKK